MHEAVLNYDQAIKYDQKNDYYFFKKGILGYIFNKDKGCKNYLNMNKLYLCMIKQYN